MKALTYESWIIEYDDMFTQQILKNVVSGPQSCGCGNCKNFILARDKVYPDDLKKLLEQLGIDYQKETEICHFNRIKAGQHFYGGWFHFVGEIKETFEYKVINIGGRVPDIENFAWSFSERHDLVPKEFGQAPVVQLDWLAVVPWLMESEEPT